MTKIVSSSKIISSLSIPINPLQYHSLNFPNIFAGKEYAKKENLKEMGDVSSGMASTVIQVYLKCILDSFVHPSMQARHATLKVIQLILAQGLVHPVQIVPYLICMATDIEQRISHTADRELQVRY